MTVRNPSETSDSKALTTVTTTGEGGLGGVSVPVAVDKARTSEYMTHVASSLEGPVLTSRKDGSCLTEVVESTKTIVGEPSKTEAADKATFEYGHPLSETT